MDYFGKWCNFVKFGAITVKMCNGGYDNILMLDEDVNILSVLIPA